MDLYGDWLRTYTTAANSASTAKVTPDSILAAARKMQARRDAWFRKACGPHLTLIKDVDSLAAVAKELRITFEPGETETQGKLGGLHARFVDGIGVVVWSEQEWYRTNDPIGYAREWHAAVVEGRRQDAEPWRNWRFCVTNL